MADEDSKVDELKKDLEKLQAALANLNTKVEEFQAERAKAKTEKAAVKEPNKSAK